MSSPASGSLRGLRVAIVAVAGTLLAAAAHVAAGGDLPSSGVVASGAVIPAVAGLWLSGKRRGWLSIAAVLGGVQVVLHSWLMSAMDATTCLADGGGGHLAHAATAMIRCSSGSTMPDLSSVAPGHGAGAGYPGVLHLVGASGAMVLAHALAVVLTAFVLAAGERAVWQLLQWLRPALQVVRAALPVRVARATAPLVATVPVRRLCSADLSGLGRRGPPASS